METTEDFDDLAPRARRVKIGDAEYEVREASTAAAKKFQNVQMAAYRMDDGKLTGTTPTFFDSEPQLVADCTVVVTPDGVKPLRLADVLAWPDRVTARLFDLIKDLSPSLTGRQTVEGIDRQVEKLLSLREKLAAAGGDGPKAQPGGGTTASS